MLTSLLCSALFAVAASAQQPSAIVGHVTDKASNQPVSDANVTIVGTPRGARTGENGAYRIPNVTPGTYTVRVNRLGYGAVSQQVTVPAGGEVTADFQLVAATTRLEEVMVTATGATERKRENGNDVGLISPGKDVNLAATPDLTSVLAARTAGLTITQSMGTAGTSSRIRIRGANSVSLGNEPLLIIDGVRAENSTNASSLGVGGATTSRFDDLNPDDIESIEVL
ncbi:MAG TPA: carboxypeptidase regulatory-like domain-containing protein, partial [Gemmatimonadaceae bacterium]|nr:carboxypeptidase regulatory-like domain-containing protein [Gemmatimonadaceae bacterium]